MISETNAHRVYLVDDNKKPIGVISLTDIINTMVKSVI
jgi:CBS-domain-containing membrane protein